MTNKKILITGGAGFIGSNLCKYLCRKKEFDITIVDDFSRGKIENLKGLDVEILKYDLSDIEQCYVPFNKSYDFVIHLAGKVGSISYYRNYDFDVIYENSVINNNVLHWILKNKIPNLIFTSSTHVYPLYKQKEYDSKQFREYYDDKPYDPILGYGWSKLFFEKQLEALSYQQNLKWKPKCLSLRLIGIYGRNQDNDKENGSFIPSMIKQIKENDKIKLWTNGEEYRSFCYVDDICELFYDVIHNFNNKYLRVYNNINAGSSERIKIKEVAELIKIITKSKCQIEFSNEESMIKCQWADCHDAKFYFGWESKTSLEEGIKKII